MSTVGPGTFRLFLAAMVVVHHLGWVALGPWAVDVFFILSGYWVALMWSERYRCCHRPYATFVVSRFWRLWPLYALCVGLTLLLIYTKGPHGRVVAESIASPPWLLRALAIVSATSQAHPLPPTWSLDVEMQFYLLLPIFCGVAAWLAQRQRSLRSAVGGALFLLAAWGVARPQGGAIQPYLPCHVFFFWIGLWLYRSGWTAAARWAVGTLLGGASVVAVLWFGSGFAHALVDATAASFHDPRMAEANRLCSAGLALATVPFLTRNVRVRSGPLDQHCGQLAYALYLWHWTPKLAVNYLLDGRGYPPWLLLTAELSLVLVGAGALYWFFDRPIDAWRRAWVRARVVERG